MACNFSLNDKLMLGSSTYMRNESFGKLVVSKGGATLCLNDAASYIVDLCDGTLSAQKVIEKIVLSVQTDDRHSLSSKIEKILDALCGVNVLVVKK
ncbi:hypothetical protein FACS189472_04330 [Alphaproteobacteria bacterium]|nr:hypothetical protein FACS189472_04330 [Alphaproteobacteria bacterium]